MLVMGYAISVEFGVDSTGRSFKPYSVLFFSLFVVQRGLLVCCLIWGLVIFLSSFFLSFNISNQADAAEIMGSSFL